MNSKTSSRQPILIVFTVFVLALCACTPLEPKMSYQGQLASSEGELVPDENYQMTFRFYNAVDDAIADALWTETQSVSVIDGLFNVTLGEVTAIDTGLFAQKLWLGVEVEGDGEMTPRQELTGAPFAMSLAPGAAIQGIIDFDAGYPGLLNLNNRGTGVGVAINHWGKAGLAINGAFDPTSSNPVTTGDYGLMIDSVQHGALITATEGIGVHVIGQGTTTGDDDGIRVEAVADGIVAISSGPNSGDYGVYAQTQGGRAVYGYTISGAYAGYFDGAVYMQSCTGCTLRYVVRNTSTQTLQPGDLVTASGIDTALAGQSQPLIEVEPVTAGQTVLGVVVGRTGFHINEAGVDEGAPGLQFDTVGGAAAPDEYLIIVVQGPAQVRTDRATVRAGELVYFGAEGLTADATEQTVGMVLDEADKEGMVWIMLGFH